MATASVPRMSPAAHGSIDESSRRRHGEARRGCLSGRLLVAVGVVTEAPRRATLESAHARHRRWPAVLIAGVFVSMFLLVAAASARAAGVATTDFVYVSNTAGPSQGGGCPPSTDTLLEAD